MAHIYPEEPSIERLLQKTQTADLSVESLIEYNVCIPNVSVLFSVMEIKSPGHSSLCVRESPGAGWGDIDLVTQ